MSISIFGIIVGALLWGIVLSSWSIVRRKETTKTANGQNFARRKHDKDLVKIPVDTLTEP